MFCNTCHSKNGVWTSYQCLQMYTQSAISNLQVSKHCGLKQINMLVRCCSRFDATACVGEVMQDTAAVALLLLLLLLCCYVAMTSFVLLP